MLSIVLRAESDLVSQAESEVRWRGLGASGSVRGEAAQSTRSVDIRLCIITSVGTVKQLKNNIYQENRMRKKIQNY